MNNLTTYIVKTFTINNEAGEEFFGPFNSFDEAQDHAVALRVDDTISSVVIPLTLPVEGIAWYGLTLGEWDALTTAAATASNDLPMITQETLDKVNAWLGHESAVSVG